MCGENTNDLDWPQIHALYRLTLPKEGTRPQDLLAQGIEVAEARIYGDQKAR